ncbi:CPBP family intramembrane glutamic endopeptidase [Xanthocytophaga flava]|uniref:CPBP family intramembrane glutamic endopeptidase n=1 Tax=Xanthocytophaga flava TaxID=3048013 RepID=UPI0028D46A8C|nr:type II CAAX endopeptidase family protein [Xanthocytophaga flavus]MDJ1472672.1 type II CAAX endopeptidase family protein [Xanthocytophaga flavus]
MQQPYPPRPLVNPIIGLILLVGFGLLGLSLGTFVLGILSVLPYFDGDPVAALLQINQMTSNNDFSHPHAWEIVMIVQAFSSFGGFILAAWIYLFFIEGKTLRSINTNAKIDFIPLLLIVFLGLAFIILNEWIYQWNRNWDLPDWLSGFEDWSRSQQEKLGELTQFLTNFDSFSRLIIALIVIAVLPAIGEELMFRAAMQSIFLRWFRNPHAAVWVTGAIFSFIHFQLDGFIPRLLLGVVFGYLYVWSGNIWYAIWAHFINNGVTVLGVFFNKSEKTKIDLEHTEWITWSQALIAAAISSVILWYLKRLFDQYSQPNQSISEEYNYR